MKKAVAVFLTLVFLLPMTAGFAELDPIVGSWYMYFDTIFHPEVSDIYENSDRVILVYQFLDNETITGLYLNVSNDNGDAEYSSAGKWEKSGDTYKFSILGLGEGLAILEDDCLYISTEDTAGISIRLRRLIPFNPYKDYVYK